MAITKEKKQVIVQKLEETIGLQKLIVFVAIEKLKAKEMSSLRQILKKEECLLSVIKKTLTGIAFKKVGIEMDLGKLEGQVAMVFGFKDEVAAAKVIYQFSRKNENLRILGGFLENQFKTKEEIISLAKIESKEVLMAKVVGSIASPISGFVNVLQGNIKGFINILTKIKN